MLGWTANIEALTLANQNLLGVLFIGTHTQLTLMRLLPGEEIG